MNQATYQEGLEEFLQYEEKLIGDNLLPYADQISGHWKASTIKGYIEDSYARATRVCHPEFSGGKSLAGARGQNEETLEGISSDLSGKISEEIFRYFSQHGKGLIFVIDFQIFRKDMENKLLAIQNKY
jgi:hypothetical protein